MSDLPRTFSALSDPTRLSLVELLMDEGELPAGALVAHAGLTAPAVSRHLRVLLGAGLVTRRAQGTHRLYRVDPGSMRRIADWTGARRAFWEASLDRLDALLAEEGKGNE